jgi:hypothetical protein
VQIDLAGLIADIMPQTIVKKAFVKRGGRATSPTKAMHLAPMERRKGVHGRFPTLFEVSQKFGDTLFIYKVLIGLR